MASSRVFFLLVAPLLWTTAVIAWGIAGHQAIGSIAQQLLLPETSRWTRSILSADTTLSSRDDLVLPAVASWADKFPKGGTSTAFHFIKTREPNFCVVDMERDCKGDCVVRAIAKHTAEIQDATLSDLERSRALKFLVHYFGDITQPLHAQGFRNGGTGIKTYNGNQATTLHFIWDDDIPARLLGWRKGDPGNNSRIWKWAKNVVTHVREGYRSSELGDYLRCSNVNTPEDCALEWVQEANKISCLSTLGTKSVQDFLWMNFDPNSGYYDKEYYDRALQVVEDQLVKAGVRLAAWLNLLCVGEVGFKSLSPTPTPPVNPLCFRPEYIESLLKID